MNMGFIHQLFKTNASDAEEARKRKLLTILLFGIIGCCVLFLVSVFMIRYTLPHFLNQEEFLRLCFICGLVLFLSLICFLLNRYVSGLISAILFTLCLTVIISFSDVRSELSAGRSVILFVFPIVISSLIIRPYAGYFFAGVSGIIITIFSLMQGRFPGIPSIFVFFLIAFICWIATRSLDVTLRVLREANESVEKALSLQQETRKELKDSEERYGSFVDNFKGITYKGEMDFRAIYFHGAVEEITGYTKKDFVSGKLRWDQVIHKEDMRKMYRSVKGIAGIPHFSCDREYRIIRKDGTVRWIHEFVQNSCDDRGKPQHIFGVIYDITEQKKIDSALKESRRRLEAIFSGTMDAIFLVDDKGGFVDVNPAASRITGYSRQELLSMSIWDMQTVDAAREERQKDWEAFLQKGSHSGESMLQKKDGNDVMFECMAKAHILPGLHLIIIKDITKRLKLEEQLRHSVKMEALGRLASGIAHDFNNLLTTIFGYCDIAKLHSSLPGDVKEIFREIRGSAEMASILTKQLLAFSRKQVMKLQVFELNELIRNMKSMLQRIIGEDIGLSIITSTDELFVRADTSHMEQIIMNLVVNSRDAMPGGGKLTIETGVAMLDTSYTELHAGVKPGEYVMIALTDTGCGMDDETKKHIFEPFFTTKEREKGTGLGLATVFGIVRQSEGHINVYSEAGEGTTFKIYLPRKGRDEHAEKQSEPETKEGAAGGSETLLLVEDDIALRKVMKRSLTSLGYRVIDTGSGIDALTLVGEQKNTPVDLLVTDVILPEMNSKTLTENLRKIFPGLKVLYISGYTEHVIINHGILKDGIDFLPKPFTPDILAQKVRDILDV
jgi:two-component system cell cycle sensor histidine kinase/response regulator CckA